MRSIFYHVLNSSLPHPTVFLCKFRQIAKPIFSRSGVTPTPPVASAVLKERCKLSQVGLHGAEPTAPAEIEFGAKP